jgi:hypothetical protein
MQFELTAALLASATLCFPARAQRSDRVRVSALAARWHRPRVAPAPSRSMAASTTRRGAPRRSRDCGNINRTREPTHLSRRRFAWSTTMRRSTSARVCSNPLARAEFAHHSRAVIEFQRVRGAEGGKETGVWGGRRDDRTDAGGAGSWGVVHGGSGWGGAGGCFLICGSGFYYAIAARECGATVGVSAAVDGVLRVDAAADGV